MEGKAAPQYLLSNDIWVMTRVHFEGAIVRPEVNGVVDTGHTTFIHLGLLACFHSIILEH